MNHLLNTGYIAWICLLLLIACHHKKTPIHDQEINQELKKVLAHYKASGETDKLKAAHFLIDHMKGLGGHEIQLFDAEGAPVTLELTSFKNEKELKRTIDSLNIFYKLNFIEDAKTITSEGLIRQIEQAFQAWEQSPFSGIINFESFCEYLLPYRVDREPIEDWRSHVRQRYHWLYDSIAQRQQSLRETINMINDHLQSWFSFGKAHYKPDRTLSISDLELCKKGDC